MEHELKISPQYFDLVADGTKTFEVRRNDRNYQEGDRLYLREYINGGYTGKSCAAEIIYILNNPDYCKEGYVILGIKLLNLKQTTITWELLEAKGFSRVKGMVGIYDRRIGYDIYVMYQLESKCIMIHNDSAKPYHKDPVFGKFAEITMHCGTWEEACAIAKLAGIDLEKK